MRPLALVLLAIACVPARAQQAPAEAHLGAEPVAALVGTVTDAATGVRLRGAAVSAAGRATVTDDEGRFALDVPAGSVRLRVDLAGYAGRVVEAVAPGEVAVALTALAVPAEAALGEVVVGAARAPEREADLGRITVAGRDVQRVPAFLGETDVLRTVQTLPGVRGGQEGSAGLYVRGGSPDQTLILLDGVPVFNPSHLFGLLSTFTGEAVETADLTKGAYPASLGGRLGSVLDVRLRDGDTRRLRVQGQVGILASRLLVEGPVVPGRVSLLVAGRRSYLTTLARPFVDRANARAAARGDAQITPEVAFYDLTGRLAWRPSARDRVTLTAYRGGDAFGFDSADPREVCSPEAGCRATGTTDRYGGRLDWGNRLAALRASRVVSRSVLATLALTASDYGLDVGVDVDQDRGGPAERVAQARYRSAVRDVTASADVDVDAGRGHVLRVGARVGQQRFTPGALSLVGAEASTGAAIDTLLGTGRTTALAAALYAEDAWTAGALSVRAGVRGAVYATGRYRYPSVEPRAAVAVRLWPRVAVRASAAVTQQPLHLLTTGAGVGLPADLWVPADSVGPERGTQVALGLAGSSRSGRTSWTLDAYRRDMRGLVSYRDGAGFATPAADWQSLVVTGTGRSLGLEAFVEHRTERLTAWLGYTLARSDRRFDALDGGEPFPYRYDRRHDVSGVALLRLSRRFDLSAAAVYGTGDAVSLPTATYDATALDIGSVDYWVGSEAGARRVTAYGPRNRFRLPAYVRVDLGATLFFRRGERPHALALTVYNATNRKNPFVTTTDTRVDPETGRERQQLVGVALFPILPTLSYQFAF